MRMLRGCRPELLIREWISLGHLSDDDLVPGGLMACIAPGGEPIIGLEEFIPRLRLILPCSR